jgi:hypothetical protein
MTTTRPRKFTIGSAGYARQVRQVVRSVLAESPSPSLNPAMRAHALAHRLGRKQ